MTREEIMKLEGRELDAAVDEYVMGWRQMGYASNHYYHDDIGRVMRAVPYYSDSIADAWQLVKEMKTKNYSVRFLFSEHLKQVVTADIAPSLLSEERPKVLDFSGLLFFVEKEHFCRAALLATMP